MMQILPERREDESAIDFLGRVEIALEVHLHHCDACNYDTDCTACASGVSYLAATSHSCNCREASPTGFGVRLRQLYEQAGADTVKEPR